MTIERLEGRLLFTTYYVSPTGRDVNAGTSTAAPWQTVAKVNATAFNPGDQILFQRGGQWHESLVASSSGSAGMPITYGAYGDTGQPRPLFVGSDVVAASAFTQVSGTTATYSMPASVANWVFEDHQFLKLSNLETTSSDPTTNLNYVNANAGSFYFSGTTLYVNIGGALSGHVITVAHRDNAVLASQKNNLVFDQLATTETAKPDAGYGFAVQFGANIRISNSMATLAGKHHFGAICVTGFVGQNLTASQAPPDLGYGGASAYVSFSDATRKNDTYQWINVDWQTPNGAYPAFITHGDSGAVGSVLLQNVTSSGWGAGIVCQSTGSQEVVTIRGGHLDNGQVELDTDNSVIDGMAITGPQGSISLNGRNDVLRNSTFNGLQPNPYGGVDGGVTVSGQGALIAANIFRFGGTGGPAIDFLNATTNTTLRGNVFDCPDPIWQQYNGGGGTVTSDRNVVQTGVRVESGDILHVSFQTWSQWQAAGHDQHSLAVVAGSFAYGSMDQATAAAATAGDETLAIVRNDDGTGHRMFGSGTPGGLFYGQDPAVGAILVTAALWGDTNLDGHVDVADLGNVASAYGSSGGIRWSAGDFNYSGQIDVTDLGTIASTYGATDAALNAAGNAQPTAVVAAAPAAIVASTRLAPVVTNATPFSVASDLPLWRSRPVRWLLDEQVA